MNNIIVTGGMGYIGSHTVIELINAGYDVHIIDNLSNSDISMLDRMETITGIRPKFTNLDLCNLSALSEFYKDHKSAGTIHFAALKSVGESVKMPIKYYKNNISSLTNLLEVHQTYNCNNLVFSSSATVYGSPNKLPVDEKTPIDHTPSPYGATKQMAERIIEDFCKASNEYKAISLRYFNPIGAHNSGLIGELPTGTPNNLMPYITQTAIGIRESLSVFGSDYNTPDGTAIRDYVHVIDVATAHVKSIEFLLNSSTSNHYKINIGTGKGSSVLDVIKSFEKTTGISLNYKLTDRRAGDVESVFADVAYAESKLNWTAKYSLDQMTHSAWLWEQNLRS